VKELSHRNKVLTRKILDQDRRAKAKSVEQQTLEYRQLLDENANLKNKLSEMRNQQ
jgi:hypothetical protein